MPAIDERDECILVGIKRMNNDTAAFVIGLLTGELTRDDQTEFADQLADLAEMIRGRSRTSHGVVIEGSVIDDRHTSPHELSGQARDVRETALL